MDARHRLRGREAFARLRERGRVYRQPALSLSVVANALAHTRYGYITGKALGNAVQRNRTRRLLREAVRFRHPQVKPGFDVLLIARPSLVSQPLADVQRIVGELYRQAGLLREDVHEDTGARSHSLL
jgi:ribonuclease P protein component